MAESQSEPELTDAEIEELAHQLANNNEFEQDVIDTGLYEAIVEGGHHDFAPDHASVEVLIGEILEHMSNGLEEFNLSE